MSSGFVDTHCHLDLYDDPIAVLRRAEEAGVVTVAVTELPSAFQKLFLRFGKRPNLRLGLGIHPLRATQASAMELSLFARLLDRTDYVGEVGLDGSAHGRGSLRTQRRVFEHLLGQPRVRHKILSVHSRGAEAETITALAEVKTTAILHWYTGALKHIDHALEAGLWFSVNPAMMGSESGQRIVRALPRERVLTESDGPWTKIRGRPCEPSAVVDVVEALAELWGEEVDAARTRIYDNMRTIAAVARGEQSAPAGFGQLQLPGN